MNSTCFKQCCTCTVPCTQHTSHALSAHSLPRQPIAAAAIPSVASAVWVEVAVKNSCGQKAQTVPAWLWSLLASSIAMQAPCWLLLAAACCYCSLLLLSAGCSLLLLLLAAAGPCWLLFSADCSLLAALCWLLSAGGSLLAAPCCWLQLAAAGCCCRHCC